MIEDLGLKGITEIDIPNRVDKDPANAVHRTTTSRNYRAVDLFGSRTHVKERKRTRPVIYRDLEVIIPVLEVRKTLAS